MGDVLRLSGDTEVAAKTRRPPELGLIIVDTRVQEKAIAGPVGNGLLDVARVAFSQPPQLGGVCA